MAGESLAERFRRSQADAARMVKKNLRTVVLSGGSGALILLFGADLVVQLFSALRLSVKRSDTTGLVIMACVLCGSVLVPALATAVVQAVIWAKARRINARVARNPELAALIVPPGAGQLATLKAVAGHGRSVQRILVRLVVVLAVAAGMVWAAVVVARASSSASGWVPGLTVFFSAVVLLLVVALVRRYRHWQVAQHVRKWSEDPSLSAKLSSIGPDADGRRAELIPDLTVVFDRPRTLMRGAGPVSATRNVLNRGPLKIGYLRLFDNQARTRDFLRGAWREAGYVHLLRSAASVSPAELREARRTGGLDSMFVTSPRVFRERLAGRPATPLAPGAYRLAEVTDLPLKVRDPYGSYPVSAVLCHGSFWRMAVDLLLARVDLTVLDLSGYRPANSGTQFELQRVVDRIPMAKTVLLCDTKSDQPFVEAQIRHHWAQMAAGSPNAGAGRRRIKVWVTDNASDYRGGMKWTQGVQQHRRSVSRFVIAQVLGLTGG
ncbi:hypothetical protein M8542_33605 [Amycolatopsis sp. OK19-0408]|uniref:Uncharacterized protein n=1 Tax=Amycolatopsis iheyensis TaxID=2945988 RepID=A0A9X2NI97_9PSEU|nr:hypothetical protein [Amycolatopsis iheyensis]MCR6487773.1 hypothetical protein [Amycolatopsis iheyensis]